MRAMRRISVVTLALLSIAAACAPGAPARPSATSSPTAPSPADALAAAKARGSLIVAIRVATPPAGVQQQDVAHGQKRAFEDAVASAVAKLMLGPNARVQFKEMGRDRATLVERGEADLAMTFVDAAAPAAFSTPYAAGGIVLGVRESSPVREAQRLAGQTIAATTMGELNASDAGQSYLRENGIAATVSPVPGLAAAVAALDAGQVAAVMADRTGIAVLQRGRAEAIRIIATVASRPYAIAMRKDAVTLRDAVNMALAQLLASGEIRRMADAAAFPYEAP